MMSVPWNPRATVISNPPAQSDSSTLTIYSPVKDERQFSPKDRSQTRLPYVKVFNIPEGTTQGELQKIFSIAGNVKLVKILPCREGKNVTLGFVEYETVAEVNAAVELVDNHILNDSKLHIVLDDAKANGVSSFHNARNPSSASNAMAGGRSGVLRKPQCKVFNIPDGTEQSEIRELFSSVGEVTNVKILPCRDGKDVTLGFVGFDTEDSVDRAIATLNNATFKGSTLRVMPCPIQDQGAGLSRFGNGERNDGTPPDWFGAESSNALGRAKGPAGLADGYGSPRTFGKSPFMNGDVSTQSSAKPDRPMGRGARLIANVESFGQRERQRNPQAKVFGFPEGTTQDEVKSLFAEAGVVRRVNLLPIQEGKTTHLTFVEFESQSEVEDAVARFDSHVYNGSKLKVLPGDSAKRDASTGLFGASPVNGDFGARPERNGFSARPDNSWGSSSPPPTGRLPRQEPDLTSDKQAWLRSAESNRIFSARPDDGRKSLPRSGDISVPDLRSDEACRRCGEVGHFARDCLNAPVSRGASAVTYVPPPPPDTEKEIFEQGIHQGLNFEKYANIPVEVTGRDTVGDIASFEEANLHEGCLKNVKRAGFKVPTPVQKFAIPVVMKGRDLMACAQTGSGKTAAFLLPVLTKMLNEGLPSSPASDFDDELVRPIACVLAPTRELAVQIFLEIRKFAYATPVQAAVVYGGVSVSHQLEKLRYGSHIIVGTPGRLEDFVKRGKISFSSLRYLILDEADRMLDMGFGPQMTTIVDKSDMPPKTKRCTLMFSATFPEEVQRLAQSYLHDYLFLTVGRVGGVCSDVQQTVLEISARTKRDKLEQILRESGTDRTLVFVERKRDADFLAGYLSQKDFPTTSLNADRSQQEREAALLDFRSGRAPVLVATAVAARGLDINDVKHVINYDLPSDTTEYVHRIGRTGRIGNKGMATSFFDRDRDAGLARGLVKLLAEGEQTVPDWLEQVALEAVGSSFGPDGGQFSSRDRRTRFGPDNRRSQNARVDSEPIKTGPSASNQTPVAAAAAAVLVPVGADVGEEEDW